jgi:hypothetical protein
MAITSIPSVPKQRLNTERVEMIFIIDFSGRT